MKFFIPLLNVVKIDIYLNRHDYQNRLSMKFITTIFQKGNNLGIEVPQEIIDQLGAGKKPAVVVSIGNHSYRSTVAVMQDKYLIALSREHRKSVNVNGGDQLEIDIELDDQPRIIEVPEPLAARFEKNPDAKSFFETLSPSNKKKIVLLIASAKTEETRSKRLDKVISDLGHQIKP